MIIKEQETDKSGILEINNFFKKNKIISLSLNVIRKHRQSCYVSAQSIFIIADS